MLPWVLQKRGQAQDSSEYILLSGLQSDAALFRRLCPVDKHGKMHFVPVMLTRLRKLGIKATDPAQLTVEEQSKCAT